MLFPDCAKMRMLALHPTMDKVPESSLSTMISWCMDEFGTHPSLCPADRERVDYAAAVEFILDAEHEGAPLCVLATTAAVAGVFQRMRSDGRRARLAVGSRMMDTGGSKGQIVSLTPSEVAAHALEYLGIEPDFVVNEYGMTELCSQLYDATHLNSSLGRAPGQRVKLAPPWMRPYAIDPATMRPVADGTPGLLGFIDLANVGSVSAIVTEDLGMVEDGAVQIFGRAIAGGPRGCALSIAEFQAIAREHGPDALGSLPRP